MGCASSRFDKRNDNAGDLNTVGLQFTGGEANEFDEFPMDRVAWGFDKTKAIGENFKIGADLAAEDEATATAIYKATWTAVNNKIKALGGSKWVPSMSMVSSLNPLDAKKNLVDGRTDKDEALKQLNAVKEFFNANSGIEMEPKKEVTPAMMMADGMMMDAPKMDGAADAMMEGGDEMMMGGDMMMGMDMMAMMANPHKYENDARKYEGWA